MEEKVRFVFEYEQDQHTMSELCQRYGIARETGYVWLRRYRQSGVEGLLELNRAPRRHPNQTAAGMEQAVLELRQAHMRWGPRKLKRLLERDQPGRNWPAASTIGALVRREGLVVARKKRRRTAPYTEPLAHAEGPNRVWCADFKGWFRTGDGERIDPLGVWWMKLGIVLERIAAGHPEQNGRHERMHRTLKQETAEPPAVNRRAQQRAFDRFRQEYNEQHPHEALAMQTPAAIYAPSPRSYPARVPEPEYPTTMLVRSVHHQGQIRWKKNEVFLSEVLWGERIGLLPVNERWFTIYFAEFPIARFDARKLRVLPLPQEEDFYSAEAGEGDASPSPASAIS